MTSFNCQQAEIFIDAESHINT